MIIFSGDNGSVLDDGYQDEAVTKLNGPTPSGILPGGKCSVFEAGTRMPIIVYWPAKVTAGVSTAMISKVDLLVSLRQLEVYTSQYWVCNKHTYQY